MLREDAALMEKTSEIRFLKEEQRIEKCFSDKSTLKECCVSGCMLPSMPVENCTQTDPIVGSHLAPLVELDSLSGM
jgi:hypothetical protein